MRTVTQVKTTTVFTFSELSAEAQAAAINSWIATEPHDGWYEELENLFKNILGAIGFSDVSLYFSGFSQQGDGASFSGNYQHQKGSKKALTKMLKKDWNKPDTLERVMHEVNKIIAVQKKYGYRVHAVIKKYGMYEHSGMMRIESEQVLDTLLLSISNEHEHCLLKAFRAIADIYYDELYKTYLDLVSEETAREYCLDHEDELEYDENGKPYYC